jgi:hypothetical protein
MDIFIGNTSNSLYYKQLRENGITGKKGNTSNSLPHKELTPPVLHPLSCPAFGLCFF